MSLAQRVRDCRYSKGWGPDELASRAAISRTALYQIESGKTELPRAGTLRRIALALEVSMDLLLGHAESPTPVVAQATPPRPQSEWIPSEGSPLTVPSIRATLSSISTIENPDGSRFGVETPLPPSPGPAPSERRHTARDRELAWKLQELLSSSLGEGIARIIEESYRLLPPSRQIS